MIAPWRTKAIHEQYSEHTSECCFQWPLSHTRFISPNHLSHLLWEYHTVPQSSRSIDDLMQDEKRQHPFFSIIPHGIYFLSTLIILWSIKACSKSRCILPQADSTCKHFLSRNPLPSPEAKHDYPILMRFLMWFFFSLFQFLQDNPTLSYVHTVVNVCRLMVCKKNTCWLPPSHASFFCLCRPEFCVLPFMFAWCW